MKTFGSLRVSLEKAGRSLRGWRSHGFGATVDRLGEKPRRG